MTWKGMVLSGVNALLKAGLKSIPLIGPALADTSARLRFEITGALGDKIFNGEKCPVCGGALVERHKNGRTFIGCSNYAKIGCRYTRSN